MDKVTNYVHNGRDFNGFLPYSVPGLIHRLERLFLGESRPLSKKLFVGNLPFSASEDGIREMFAEFGTIESLAWITDRDTGRFRGFCFIEMDDAAAQKAIQDLDGKDFDGRNMRVNEAQPREDRRGGGGRGGYNRGGGNRGGNRGSGGGYRDSNRGGGNRW